MVSIWKDKSAGRKKTKSTQKRKGPANQKPVEVKSVVLSCDEHDDMIAKSTLPKRTPNQYILYMLKSVYIRNLAQKCVQVLHCGGTFYEKGYPQEPNDLAAVKKLHGQFVDSKAKVPTM